MMFPFSHSSESANRPILTLDTSLYQHYLEDSNLSDEEKREVLQMLWNLICEFVYLGFGVTSVQQIQDNCGQQLKLFTENEETASDPVESKESSVPSTDFLAVSTSLATSSQAKGGNDA
jgi:hypothetical protein